jgi:molybdopterin converting factor small subunit
MQAMDVVTVRVFGVLREFQRERGLVAETVERIPADGVSAGELAELMGLPVDSIEGAFCNHTIYGLTHVVVPGDQVAFVPYGTPGPHRYFLGLYKAGHEER